MGLCQKAQPLIFYLRLESELILLSEHACSEDQRQHEQDKENEEQYSGDRRRTFRNSPKSENRRNYGDDEKYNRPA